MKKKQHYTHEYFVKMGRSWWEGLTEEEKEKKREMNRAAAKKRWNKHKKKTLDK